MYAERVRRDARLRFKVDGEYAWFLVSRRVNLRAKSVRNWSIVAKRGEDSFGILDAREFVNVNSVC